MPARTRLFRSIPYWILVVVSLVVLAVGTWLVAQTLSSMNSALAAETATGVDVYGGQSLIGVGTALITAGLVGVIAALSLAALRSALPTAPVPAAEPIDWAVEGSTLEVEPDAATATDADADVAAVRSDEAGDLDVRPEAVEPVR